MFQANPEADVKKPYKKLISISVNSSNFRCKIRAHNARCTGYDNHAEWMLLQCIDYFSVFCVKCQYLPVIPQRTAIAIISRKHGKNREKVII